MITFQEECGFGKEKLGMNKHDHDLAATDFALTIIHGVVYNFIKIAVILNFHVGPKHAGILFCRYFKKKKNSPSRASLHSLGCKC